MQREMDLIRLILLELEKAPGAFTGEMKFDGYSPEQVGYHCWLLLEGGFALGVETTHQGSIGREAVATTLTWVCARDDAKPHRRPPWWCGECRESSAKDARALPRKSRL